MVRDFIFRITAGGRIGSVACQGLHRHRRRALRAGKVEEVKAAQGPEIEQLQTWLAEWDVDPDAQPDDHSAHMDGMLSADDIAELEHWLEIAIRDGFAKAQEIAAEKMKPLMGGLGNLGL